MARRRGGTKRRRRGRFAFLYKLLSVFLVSSAMVLALILFFKVETVSVSGNQRYTQQQVVAATGVQVGDNLYLLNKFELKDRLIRQLPYVDRAVIYRKLPGTLVIEVGERDAAAVYLGEEQAWLISSNGKLLEQVDLMYNGGLPAVSGTEPLAPSVGGWLALPEEQSLRRTKLLELLAAAEEMDLLEKIPLIELQDEFELVFQYEERFRVELDWNADCRQKLERLLYYIQQLEANEVGTMDMTEEGVARFIPVA